MEGHGTFGFLSLWLASSSGWQAPQAISMSWISCGHGELSPGLSPIPGRPATILALRALESLAERANQEGTVLDFLLLIWKRVIPGGNGDRRPLNMGSVLCLPLSKDYAVAFSIMFQKARGDLTWPVPKRRAGFLEVAQFPVAGTLTFLDCHSSLSLEILSAYENTQTSI